MRDPSSKNAAWLSAIDDVATALADLAQGTVITLTDGAAVRTVRLRQDIRIGHKFAVRDLGERVPVRKYGEYIGRTSAPIAAGAWVHDHNLEPSAEQGRDRHTKDIAVDGAGAPGRSAQTSARNSARTSATFLGYRRPDGRAGVRNHVLILSPTGLTSAAAARVSALVRGTICVASGYGRGQVAADAQLHFDTLCGLACNPNVAAVVVLAAGSDIVEKYVEPISVSGKPVQGYSLPDAHEDALKLVDLGVRAATRFVRDASMLRRDECAVGELCIAVECGHSDATSGLVCNPLAGRLSEFVVGNGGQAMFSETLEWTGTEHLLASRAIDAGVADRIVRAVASRERMASDSGADPRAQNPGPQNKAGGLTTLEEKSLGAIAKGGRQPISGLLRPAERPAGPGLYLMDTPFFSPESITAMVAAGAQLVLFTTGAGNSYCSLVAPTLKMSANPESCARLTEQIDIAAADVVTGAASIDAAAEGAIARLLDVASGTLTLGEIVGEGSEVVSRIGPSM